MQRIPVMVRDGLRKAGYIEQGDVYVDIYPIDVNKLILFVELQGSYIDENGQEIQHPAGTIKFFFPYTKERIMEWT